MATTRLDLGRSGIGRNRRISRRTPWAGGDQQAASSWLARQSAGPERDAGAAAPAEKVRDSDPEAAAIWGATLGDGEQRRRSLQETFQTWYRKSVPDALGWLKNAPAITDSDRAFLLGSAAAGHPQK